MGLSVKNIAGALNLDARVVERLAKYLYPNKVLLTNDEALVLRDYYYKFGGGPAGAAVGPYNEWMKLERMKTLVRARLEMIEEKQNAVFTEAFIEKKQNAVFAEAFEELAAEGYFKRLEEKFKPKVKTKNVSWGGAKERRYHGRKLIRKSANPLEKPSAQKRHIIPQ
jgi:hypothetical protein